MKKIFLGLAVAAILVLTSASEFERIECLREQKIQTRIYEAKIKELITKLRDQLKEGIPEKNIPPMDPIVMKGFHLNLNEEWAQLDWNMTGEITGLMGFEPTDVKFKLAGLELTLGLLFGTISGRGTYTIDGALAQLLPVYGHGDFNVTCDGLKLLTNFKIGSNGTGENQHLFLKNASFHLNLDRFDFGVTGLMNNTKLNDLMSAMISESMPDWIELFQPTINDVVSTKITEFGDKFLENKTISDILGMLKPTSKPYIIHCGDP